MDGAARFKMITELRREMHAEGTSDERALEILAEIKKLQAQEKPVTHRMKKEREQYMTVLGGYVLDMHDHGRLVGFRDPKGDIVRRS